MPAHHSLLISYRPSRPTVVERICGPAASKSLSGGFARISRPWSWDTGARKCTELHACRGSQLSGARLTDPEPLEVEEGKRASWQSPCSPVPTGEEPDKSLVLSRLGGGGGGPEHVSSDNSPLSLSLLYTPVSTFPGTTLSSCRDMTLVRFKPVERSREDAQFLHPLCPVLDPGAWQLPLARTFQGRRRLLASPMNLHKLYPRIC